jgi:hypothetical protein
VGSEIQQTNSVANTELTLSTYFFLTCFNPRIFIKDTHYILHVTCAILGFRT